jgi:hypothetical protein
MYKNGKLANLLISQYANLKTKRKIGYFAGILISKQKKFTDYKTAYPFSASCKCYKKNSRKVSRTLKVALFCYRQFITEQQLLQVPPAALFTTRF